MSKLDAIWELVAELVLNRHSPSDGVASAAEAQVPSASSSNDTIKMLRDTLGSGVKKRARIRSNDLSPKALVEFSASIANRLQPNSILDPVCGYGMLLAGVAESTGAETVHGIESNVEVASVASIILGENAVIHDEWLGSDEKLLERYDMIVADPPLGARLSLMQTAALGLKAKSIGLAEGLLVWVASRLTESGVALIVVPPSFFFNEQSSEVLKALEKLGCYISVAIHLPRGELSATNAGSYLLVVERGCETNLFVGQLNSDPRHQKQLLANLLKRKQNREISLGRLCPISEFIGYNSFAAQVDLKKLARELGWKELAAGLIFRDYVLLNGGKQLKEDANSLYLRIDGQCCASTRLEELRSIEAKERDFRNILHLKVDPEVADPAFMEHWFNNTRIGLLTVSAITPPTAKRRLKPKYLRRAKLFVPTIDEQKLFLEGVAHIGRVRADVASLEKELFSGSKEAENLVERIRTINQEDRYEDWLEALPFPLASILWRDRASQESFNHRCKILVHFFEATAAFLATVHLSAFMGNDEAWEKYRKKLKENFADQNDPLAIPTLGTWRGVFECLSSACATMISEEASDGDKLGWQRVFHTNDITLVKMLADKRLRKILQESNSLRNKGLGHGGLMGENTAEDYYNRLKGLVDQVREVFGKGWNNFELIQPDTSRYSQGVHAVTSKRLMGTRSAPFAERVYKSRHPLDVESLYLFDSVSQQGLKLRHFIKVMPAQEKKVIACYFFNRREKGTHRWVSHHFEHEPEMEHLSNDVDDALERLKSI